MYKVSVQSLNECFNVDGDDFLLMDDTDIEVISAAECHPRKGKKHSEESKEKMRQKALGRKYSQEVKDKLSDLRKGKSIHSEEHKQRQRERMLGNSINAGRKVDPEVVKRRQESFRKTMELRKLKKEQRT
jgi:hypothetical protein